MLRPFMTTLIVLASLWRTIAIAESCVARPGAFAVNGVSLYWEEHGKVLRSLVGEDGSGT